VFDGASEVLEVSYLAPGRIMATAERRVVRTILGSCVSVTLHDARLRVGGLSHFLLPGTDVGAGGSCRYGESALDQLLDEMKRLGATPSRLRAGVFGGARVLHDAFQTLHLGERNVEFAFSWLRRHNIDVAARDVLGSQARRLEFRVPDGSVDIRLLGGT
jgi:chemotaxis protein CheD